MKKVLLVSLCLILFTCLTLEGCSASQPTPQTTTQPPITKQAPPPAQISPSTPSSPSTTPPPTSIGSPIKIGFIAGFTGESGADGPIELPVIQYRLDQIGNQFSGRPIQLIQGDDASDPTVAINVIKKQTLLDKVDVIIGPTFGGAAVAVGNFMKTADPPTPILIVAPKNGVVLQSVANNNVFLPWGTDPGLGYYMGLYAYDKLGYKTGTALYEDMVSGQGVVGAAVQAFTKEGGKVIQQQAVKSGTVDFSPYIAALQPADSIFFWFTPGLLARFMTQYFASGKTMPVWIPNGAVAYATTLTQLGDKAVGVVCSITYSTLVDTPGNAAFVADFQKKNNGAVPSNQGVGADVGLQEYLAALKATGGDTTPAKINAALHNVKVDTEAGTFSFSSNGLGIGNYYIAQVVKLADRYDWKVIQTYGQVVMDVPK